MENKISIENAQFTLYYLLIAADGHVNDKEKDLFLQTVTRVGKFTRSYSESVFNAMHRFSKTLNYSLAVENLSGAPLEKKDETVRILRELSFADGSYEKNEVGFILKIQKDLSLI